MFLHFQKQKIADALRVKTFSVPLRKFYSIKSYCIYNRVLTTLDVSECEIQPPCPHPRVARRPEAWKEGTDNGSNTDMGQDLLRVLF